MKKIIIASGPVIVEDGKALLDKQGDDQFWKFCGGKVKEDENASEAAMRRAKEELGIEIDIVSDEPYVMHVSKETPQGPIDVLLIHFLAKRKGDINPRADVHAWDWLPVDNLPSEIGPNIRPALKHFGFLK